VSEPSTTVEQTASADTKSVAQSFVTIIEPPRGWQLINAQELWNYRELLFFLAWRDIKVRYKQTVLGAAWALLQPAMMMLVFYFIFKKLANVDTGSVPYPLFVLAGLLPWNFFSTAMTNAANSVIGSERLITKIYFPRLLVPFGAVGAACMDFLIACGLLALMMAWYHESVTLSWTICLLPAITFFLVLAALGVGVGLAALNVAYRDFRYVIPFLVQLWMFATPTIYMLTKTDTSESWVQWAMTINPLTGLIGSFRAALFGDPINWLSLGSSVLIVCILFVIGCLYFRKVEDQFADII
jgi:lipopolysaccharide transport system permease protein